MGGTSRKLNMPGNDGAVKQEKSSSRMNRGADGINLKDTKQQPGYPNVNASFHSPNSNTSIKISRKYIQKLNTEMLESKLIEGTESVDHLTETCEDRDDTSKNIKESVVATQSKTEL